MYNYGQPGDENVHPWRYPPGMKAEDAEAHYKKHPDDRICVEVPKSQRSGLGFQPTTGEVYAIVGGLTLAGGVLGWFLGGKKHRYLGAGIGAVAGAAVVPVVASHLYQK